MESAALGAPPPAPTHRLRALRSFLFPEPNLMAPPLDCLSIGSPLCVVTTEGAYSRLAGGGWLYSKHLQPIAAASPDFVATALEFLGRSEETRVGKEWGSTVRYRWSPVHSNKKYKQHTHTENQIRY